MPRVLWKGSISFGLVNIPVGLYSAENRNSFDLTMLDKRSMKPVGFKRYNKQPGKEVEWGNIIKGYEYEKGKYVVLTDEDFRRANVKATQTIDILGFVDAAEIAPMYYETPYYLAPEKRGAKGYALLRETLANKGKAAIANVVIRTRQYVAAVLPVGDVIMMNTLRYANEIRPAKDLEVPSHNLKPLGISSKESQMASQLMEDMGIKWIPDKFHDTYHEDLLKLIKKRIKARETKLIDESPAVEEERPQKGEVIDLMALLKQSVQKGHKGRPHRPAKHVARRKAA